MCRDVVEEGGAEGLGWVGHLLVCAHSRLVDRGRDDVEGGVAAAEGAGSELLAKHL